MTKIKDFKPLFDRLAVPMLGAIVILLVMWLFRSVEPYSNYLTQILDALLN